MIPKVLISNDLSLVKTSDTVSQVMMMMEDVKVQHLPIVNNLDYLGLISENDLYNANDLDEPIGSLKLNLNRPHVNEDQHTFDAIKIASEYHLTAVPVLDKKDNFLGVITLERMIDFMANITAVKNPGGIIVLEIGVYDYVLSEIAQIVETNDAKILSLFIHTDVDTTLMEVTLKINKADTGPILKAFHRYDYVVKMSYDENAYVEDMKERFESFLNYMSM